MKEDVVVQRKIEKQPIVIARNEAIPSTINSYAKIKKMKYGGSVYMLTNKYHNVLYTGVTSDLKKRIYQHKNKEFNNSFTANYNCYKLVYFENFIRIEEAIAKEKQIKGGSRKAKEELIHSTNPEWKDLWEKVQDW